MNKEEILKHILKDEPHGIREKFLKNPKAALKELGVEIPEDVNIEVFQVSKKTIPFVLPEELSELESLTEEELGLVAGGNTGNACKQISITDPHHRCPPES